MSDKSLLEIARAAPANLHACHPLRDGELELLLAFLRSEVTAAQARAALGGSRSNIYARTAARLRLAVRRGEVTILIHEGATK